MKLQFWLYDNVLMIFGFTCTAYVRNKWMMMINAIYKRKVDFLTLHFILCVDTEIVEQRLIHHYCCSANYNAECLRMYVNVTVQCNM